MPRDDVKEDSSWPCGECGMGGPCVSGDEAMALAVHTALAHPR